MSLFEISRISARGHRLIASHGNGGASVQGEPEKVAALTDAARALEEAGVGYALIGGLAVGIHTRTPRATLDVDLAAMSSTARKTVTTALEAVGMVKTGEFEHSLNFRHESGEPVQVAFDPGFDPLIERAEAFDVDGVRIAIVQKQDLMAMKERAAADPALRRSKQLRDRADIEMLRGDVPESEEGW